MVYIYNFKESTGETASESKPQYGIIQVDKAKYLAVMITKQLDWGPYIDIIVAKTYGCLGFITRNISNCPQGLRELAYLS